MDNNVRSKAGQSAFDAVPKAQAVSGQYDTSQIPQQTANADPLGDYFTGQKNTQSQKPPLASSQQIQQQKQQASISSRSEKRSVAVTEMDEDDKDDRMQVAKQEVAKTETPIPMVQPSQPEVLIKKELSEIIKPGPDANKKEFPEESERLGDITEENQTQQTTAQKTDDTLPMTYGEAMLAKRKEKSPRKGVSWIIREIIKQWKQRFMKNKQTTKGTNNQIQN